MVLLCVEQHVMSVAHEPVAVPPPLLPLLLPLTPHWVAHDPEKAPAKHPPLVSRHEVHADDIVQPAWQAAPPSPAGHAQKHV